MTVSSRRIVLIVGGGIAAYKSVELARELQRRQADVRVVLTASGARFVGPITFTGITGEPAITDLWDPSYPGEVHVELGKWADAMVVAPATMNILARSAHGLVDDAALTTLACAKGPVLFAPAMHHRMWNHPSTVRAVERLRADGAHFVGPAHGALASGEEGLGRMAEPSEIADALEALCPSNRDLAGLTLLVTAGPTYEDVDPVRYLGNRSSGKMGYAIATTAQHRGANVILVSGPVSLPDPSGVETIRVRSTLEMHDAVQALVDRADAVIMAAAVADYRPVARAEQKLKRESGGIQIQLIPNPDILSELGNARAGNRPLLMGFALETENLVENARNKLHNKRVDFIVANDAAVALEGDLNQVVIAYRGGEETLPRVSKQHTANLLLDRIRDSLARS